MNKTYRVVWNHSTSTWCAASEITRGRSKTSSSSAARIAATTALVAASMSPAFAAPEEPADTPLRVSDSSSPENRRAGEQDALAARMSPAAGTRAIVTDNGPYVKIDANGNGTDNALALGEKSIAIGSNASTRPASSGAGGAIAVGSAATATANNVALGARASALGDEGAVALGVGTNAAGKSSIALGNEAKATGWGAFALGRKAQATAESGLALGDSTVASQVGAIAIGREAAASSESALSIGTNAAARAADSVAIGSYSETDREQTVSVGAAGFERQIVNVARGGQATDAVNVEQLKDVTAALGGNAGVAADGSITKPSYRVGDQIYNDVGSALQAASQTGGAGNAVQYDDETKGTVTLGGTGAAATKLTNVRAGTLAAGSTDAVNGAQLFATNNRVTNVEQSLTGSGLIDPGTGESLAVTYDSAQKDRVTLNAGAQSAALTNVKAGRLAATSTDAVNGAQLFATNKSVGDLQQSLAEGGVIDPSTGASLAVAYDSAQKGSVTLAGTGGTTLGNVKAGRVTASSMDAVNGAQLHGASSSVASALGGGSAVNADGTVSKPAYKVGDQTYTNVGDAIQAAASTGGGGGANSNAVQYDGAGKTSVTLGGTGAAPVALKNVATGVADTDAVNVKQLATGLNDVKSDIATSLGDGSLDMKYIKVKANGTQANALGKNTIAIGSNANATNLNALAVGSGARASGINSIALGVNSIATQANTVSVGDEGATRRIVNISDGIDDNDAVNMKQLTEALHAADNRAMVSTRGAMSKQTRDVSSKPGSFVAVEGLGDDGSLPNIASMNGRDPLSGTAAAVGVSSAAAGVNAVAVGLQSVAGSDHSVGIGSIAQTGVDQEYSVAIGSMVTTNGVRAIAVGSEAKANGDNSVALGNNRVAAIGDSSVAVGDGAKTMVGARNSIAMGKSASVMQNVSDAMALGANASVTAAGAGGVALGADSVANRGNALSVGSNKVQRQIVNVAKGTQGTDAVNLSQLKGVTDALGGGTSIAGDGTITAPSYKVGDKVYDNVGDALAAAGQGGTDPNAVAYDSAQKDKVTLAGTDGTTLANVKAGQVSAESKDAINGGQLHGTAQSVANALGGGSSVDANGEVSAPTYSLTDSADGSKQVAYHNVGDALENLDGRVAGNTGDITNIKNAFTNTGLMDGDGHTRAAVTYDKNADGTPNYGTATLAGADGTVLSNVAAGKADKDAVNLGQLKEAGLITQVDPNDPNKGTTSLAVTYDDVTKSKATLGGTDGTILSNVKAGVADKDAVNVSQLKSSGLVGEDGKSIAAVTYDRNADGTANYGTATLAGADGTILSNVAAGKADKDAVNLGQLKEAGLITQVDPNDPNKGMTSLAMTYDDATKSKATLGGTDGTTLTNVKAGQVSAESKDAINGGQLHGTAQSVANALGGGSSVDANGELSAPTYSLTDSADGSKQVAYHNVGDALENLDDRVAGNTGDITNIKNAFTNTGLVDGDGHTRAAVTYDKNADGTPNYGTATLAGTDGTILSNVAAGKADKDAVNLGQLKEAGLITQVDPNDPNKGMTSLAVTYDDATKSKATLGGTDGTILSNVAAGKADKDAVNLGQLKEAGLITQTDPSDPNKGMTSLAMTYDDVTKSKATLGGTDGTILSNVKAGVADKDAVNVSQLKSSGLVGEDGKSIAAV
ncbi:ESPR-type extended signal peptide-containing protein, partial [Burkholderia ubonensis]|uniref:ESPR-type extended signal peptide-containing protein n=1 Tax=Burkholderia ubonensis TaxID=101571 RepID=UPI0022B7622A